MIWKLSSRTSPAGQATRLPNTGSNCLAFAQIVDDQLSKMIMRYRASFLAVLIVIVIASCGGQSESSSSGTAPVILTSTTFLADIAQNIAGDRVRVDSLLPVGSDPHSYQPTPQDVAKIAHSKLLIINGVEYEHFLEGLLENAGGEREVIEVSAGISPRADAESEH